jgi:WD40 repeat protein
MSSPVKRSRWFFRGIASGLLLGLVACAVAVSRAQPPPGAPVLGEARRFLGHTHQVNSVAFSPDGKRIVSSSIDSTVRLWDVETGKEVGRHKDHTEIVWRVAFSSDGRSILSGGGGTYNGKTDRFKAGKDNTLRLWDSDSLKELRRFKGHKRNVLGVAFSPDGKRAYSTSFDGTIRTWDVDGEKEVSSIRAPAGTMALALSPDGKRLAASSSTRPAVVRIWDVETSKELRAFKGHTRIAPALAFSPDGNRLLSGSIDGTMRLWDVKTGKQLCALKHPSGVTSVAFFPDGRHALSGSGAQPKPGTANRFVSGPSDWLLRVWDLDKKREVLRLAGHTKAIMEVRVSPDGRHAVSAATDTTVRLWALPALPLTKKR